MTKSALTDRVDDRQTYMKGIDASYRYEGYGTYTMGGARLRDLFVGRMSFADLLVLGGPGQPDMQLVLHAMVVAIENAGGKVVRISSTTS